MVKDGLIRRVRNPALIQQGGANVCGMASFVNSIAIDDPVEYIWLGMKLFAAGAVKLGRGANARDIRPSRDVRSSKIARGMDQADWIILASLRDEINRVLTYAYDAGVPVIRDIPLVGLLISRLLSGPREAVAGITWPGDLENALRAVGYTKVINSANTTRLAGYAQMNSASDLVSKGYQVLMLINTSMLGQNAAWSATADHWVKLRTPVVEDMWAFKNKSGTAASGVRFSIYNPAGGSNEQKVPQSGFISRELFLNNFYGFVAAKL